MLEDMGEGEALSDVIQRDDRAAAEAALFAYAETLGRLHGATAGGRVDYECVRTECGAATTRGWDSAAALREELLPPFRKALEALGLEGSSEWECDVDDACDVIAAPGPFDAFSPADTCPDNHRYVRGGDGGGYLRFFDFEFSSFRHCLIDAAYTWMPFPTCWCVNRLPEGLPLQLEQAYRRALAQDCAAAADDGLFGRGLAAACVYWLVTTLGWSLELAVRRNPQWGISTHRQRHPLRAENTAAVCDRFGHFPAMADLARRIAGVLRERWGHEAEMPLYQPFR